MYNFNGDSMEIIRDRNDAFYSLKAKSLGNAFTVIENNKKYHYEFMVNGMEAVIKSDDLKYALDAIGEFRIYNKQVTKFKDEFNNFYKAFDDIFSFKLPINVIQPSSFFVDLKKIELYDEYLDLENVYLPVAIINEEYVLLDHHNMLYFLNENNVKLVNVFITDYESYINDFVYLAKENNIFNVKGLKALNHEDYETYTKNFYDEYFSY